MLIFRYVSLPGPVTKEEASSRTDIHLLPGLLHEDLYFSSADGSRLTSSSPYVPHSSPARLANIYSGGASSWKERLLLSPEYITRASYTPSIASIVRTERQRVPPPKLLDSLLDFGAEEWQFVKHPTLSCLFAHTSPLSRIDINAQIGPWLASSSQPWPAYCAKRLLRNVSGITVLDTLQEAAQILHDDVQHSPAEDTNENGECRSCGRANNDFQAVYQGLSSGDDITVRTIYFL